MKPYWLVTLGLLSWGCAGPIALHIRAEPSVPAVVRMRLTEGKEAAAPAECQAPCSVTISPGTKHQLNLQAPEYYPATMDVSYEQVRQSQASMGTDGAILVVPLQRRSSQPAVHQ